MKLKQLIEQIAPSISHIAQVKLPVKVAYRLAKNIRLLQPELDAFNEARTKLVTKYGTPESDGVNFRLDGENGAAFAKDINSLLDEDVNIALMRINLDELGSIDLEAGHIANLMDVIIYDVEQPAAE